MEGKGHLLHQLLANAILKQLFGVDFDDPDKCGFISKIPSVNTEMSWVSLATCSSRHA